MPQIILVRRSLSEPGQFQVLLQRRSGPLRHPYHWCFPGGGMTKEERDALPLVHPDAREDIIKRGALREFCEEAGGAYFEKRGMDTTHHTMFALKHIPEGFLPRVELGSFCLPPGLMKINDSGDQSFINVGKNTFMYLMNTSTDMPFHHDNWYPRATRKYRCEVDESWTKRGRHGYVFVDFEAILNSPERPVDSSSTGLVPYLHDLCIDSADEIRHALAQLVSSQDVDAEMMSAASLSLSNSLSGRYGHSRVLQRSPAQPRRTPIPRGSYLRLTLDNENYRLLEHITATIHSYFPSVFYSQLDAAAGLGGQPFHITICSGLMQTQACVEQLLETILPRAAAQCEPIHTTLFSPVTGKLSCKVTRHGRVLLKVHDLSHCIAFGQSLTSVLDGASFWYCDHPENLHVTIGSVIGTNSTKLAEFEHWFNSIYSMHLPVSGFPCRSDFVEVSEEISSITQLQPRQPFGQPKS